MWLLLSAAAQAGTGWTVTIPFGVGVFVHEKPVAGTIYALTQAAGLTVLTLGTIQGNAAYEAEDLTAGERWRFITAGGSSFAVASYFVSVLHASRLQDAAEAEEDAKQGAARAVEQGRLSLIARYQRPAPWAAPAAPFAFAGVPTALLD